MKNRYSKPNNFLITLFFLFIILAFLRTMYNFTKVFTEEKEWIFLSDSQKREKIFGNLHSLLSVTERNTSKNASVLIISDDIRVHYLSKYYLYPRKITEIAPQEIASIKLNTYSHIALYCNENFEDVTNIIMKEISDRKVVHIAENALLIK